MPANKVNWTYVTFAFLLIFLVFFLILGISQEKIHLSTPVYFFLLIVCDLGATAFLTGALKSTAEYTGSIMKGNLKVTGSAVIFLVILLIGFKYKPVHKGNPFDLTFILRPSGSGMPDRMKGVIRIELDNNPREQPVDAENKAVFTNIDARYLGKMIPVRTTMPGFKIAAGIDTNLAIPKDDLPVIRLAVWRSIDSSQFSGFVIRRNQRHPALAVAGAVLNFTDFDKRVITDSMGYFRVFLPAKPGSGSAIMVFKNNQLISSDRITLSNNIQILIDE